MEEVEGNPEDQEFNLRDRESNVSPNCIIKCLAAIHHNAHAHPLTSFY